MSEDASSWTRHGLAADVYGVAIAIAFLVAWDTVVGVSLPPALSWGGGALAFATTTWGLGALLGMLVVAGRRAIGIVAERWPPLGVAVAGAIDGAVVVVIGVLGTNPPSWSPNFRMLVVLGCVLAAIGLRLVSVRLASSRPRTVGAVGGALAVACGLGLLSMVQWRREESARLALHIVYLVGAASLARAALGAHGAVPTRPMRLASRAAVGLVAAAVLAVLLGNWLLFVQSMDARKLLHMRSSHGKSWSMVLEGALDRDRDRVSALFGGVDCDPDRRDVYPGATEVPGNGRDDNCQAGDARPRSEPAGPQRGERQEEGPATRPDIVVLSIDSLRWDATRALAATRRTLGPHAELTRAVTPCPRTLDALAATTRGRAARQVRSEGVRETRGSVLWRDPHPTLGHVLTRAGYRSMVVSTGGKTEGRAGAFAGFESVVAANYDARRRFPPVSPFAYQRVSSDVAFATALEVARATPGPIVLWVHMLEAHAPYYVSPDRHGPATREGFDASVRYADRLAAAFLRDLQGVRRRPRIVALVADHGEEFGEHGSGYHATSVYAEQARVAWLMAGPRIPTGRFDGPANITSLPATLLEALGLSAPASMVEPSVLPSMRGTAPWPAVVVTELRGGNRNLVGYTGRRHRLVRDVAHGWHELFDTEADPLEQRDLAASRPDVLATMLRLAADWEERH
ncbi:MAG: sulfatase-like hydrolase/transferase [Deltaproteobacteria bacterium]|nr:sulfatase-like hydrolase/transferase [Deltaproteobacteria bacterium]